MIVSRKVQGTVLALCLAITHAGTAHAATAARSDAGKLKDGTAVEAITLSNAKGVSARILTYGATLQSLFAPYRKRRLADVALGQETPANYEAATDKPTIVNMTNHALFNMTGDGTPQGAMARRLTIPASRFTPLSEALISTGELRPVAGSVFDFRKGRVVADGVRDPQVVIGHGYDHNFVLDKGQTATPMLAARLEDPVSGRVLEVLTTEPGVHLYTGNFIDGTVVGKAGCLYRLSVSK
jgi:galactose mutarotase-like enzyme